jgi:hypothetical protein
MNKKRVIVALSAVAIGLLCVLGHEFTTNAIRFSSPLRATIHRDSSESQIRGAILSLIPIGSSRSTVEKEIKTHFSSSPSRPDLPDQFLAQYRYSPQICIRIFTHHDIPAGGDWVEAVFIFDDTSSLKEVIIGKYGVYL